MPFKRLLTFSKEGIAKSAIIVLIYSLVERAIMLGRGILFARFLGPAEYGVFSLAMAFFPIAVALGKLGVPSCFARYIAQYEMKGSLRDFIKRTYTLVALGAVGVGALCVAFSTPIARWGYGSAQYGLVIALCGLIAVPFSFYESLDSTFTGLRSFKLQSLLKFGHFLVFTVLGVVLVLVYRRTVPLLLAYLTATLAVSLFFGGVLRRYLAREAGQHGVIAEPGFYKKVFAFSAAYMIAPIIFILFNYTDRWMLVRLTDLQHVGIYSAAIKFSELIFTFGVIAGNVLTPNLSQLWEEGKKQKVMHFLNMSIKVNTLLLLGGAFFLYLLKDQIVPWFYGAKYVDCLPIIGMIMIFGIYQTINSTLAGFAQLIEKTYIMPVCHTLGLLINLALNYLLIPQYGIMGAATASAFSSALISLILFVWFHREGFQISWSMILVCLLPLMMLLGKGLAFFLTLALLAVVLWTNWILDASERGMLLSQWNLIKKKALALRPNVTGAEQE